MALYGSAWCPRCEGQQKIELKSIEKTPILNCPHCKAAGPWVMMMNVKVENVCRAHQKRCSNCGKQPRVGRTRVMARFGKGQNWNREELCFCGEKCYAEYWKYLLDYAKLKEREGD